ncbi:MAG: hypothetical protein NVS9B1_12700 [Candidatus Dormibacteraceae bacterium]
MSSSNPVSTTAIACAAMALAAIVLALILGHPRAGLALGAGLVIGSANGYLARKSLNVDIPFRATSLGRLAVISMAGLAAGILLGMDVAWLALVGLAAAQLVLAGAAVRGMLAR